MPEFNIKTDSGISLSIDFEAYCDCGAGICANAETRYSRNRGQPQVVIKPCEDCLSFARADGRKDGELFMQDEIDTLKDELEEARDLIADLRAQLRGG